MPPDPARDAFIQLIEARKDIGGRYSNQKYVGDGNFSLVFRAIDSQTGRDVAVKVFRPDRMGQRYRFDCFCREELILEQLKDSPHILEWVGKRDDFVETVHSSSGIPIPIQFHYFAVELAISDVAAQLRGNLWDTEQKLVAFKQMCKATQRIHRKGIAHRDMKPDNFLLMAGDFVKLSDFGTARHTDGVEPPMLANYLSPPGDARYTSPEMHALLHDEDPAIAKRGDIYALGATLFEMCTGAVLGVQIFDPRFARDLAQSMGAVQKRDRKTTYLQFLPSLDAGHPLPSISAYATDVPPCLRTLADGLYKGMAALDYRRRIPDFETIFLKIDQCLLVLRNQEKIKLWEAQKIAYRKNRLMKQTRNQVNSGQSIRGKRLC